MKSLLKPSESQLCSWNLLAFCWIIVKFILNLLNPVSEKNKAFYLTSLWALTWQRGLETFVKMLTSSYDLSPMWITKGRCFSEN